MDRALNYVGLARRGGLIELGEEPVGAVARARKARLVVVAQDASDHTWRRAKSFVAGSEQICLRIPYTKDQLGLAVGRSELALAAFTDPAMALAFCKALERPERYKTEVESLEKLSERIRQRKKEADAHKRNKKMGKK